MRATSPFERSPPLTVRSKQAAGWVVFEYWLGEGVWVGFNTAGDRWTVPHFHGVGGEDVEIEHRWYRCARADELRAAGYVPVPRRPAVDSRN